MRYDGLGLSPDYLGRAAYRRDTRFILAAWSVAAIVVTIILAGAGWWILSDREADAASADRSSKEAIARVQKLEDSLAPVRRQLDQVRAFERIMNARVPAAAVLAAVETTTPADFCLNRSRFTIRASEKPQDVRLPKDYLVELSGWMRKGDQQEIRAFYNALATKLPSTSTIVALEHQPAAAAGTPDQWTLRFTLAASPDLAKAGWRPQPLETR